MAVWAPLQLGWAGGCALCWRSASQSSNQGGKPQRRFLHAAPARACVALQPSPPSRLWHPCPAGALTAPVAGSMVAVESMQVPQCMGLVALQVWHCSV